MMPNIARCLRRRRRLPAHGTVVLRGDDGTALDEVEVRLWQGGWEMVAEHFVLRASADTATPRLDLYDDRGVEYATRLVEHSMKAGDTVGAGWRLTFGPDAFSMLLPFPGVVTDPGVHGECQVCGTETDEHHPNCEIGQLRARLEQLQSDGF